MLRALLFLIVGTFVFSALLTPPIHSAILVLLPDFGHPFSRVFDRVAMLVAAILLFVQRRAFALDQAVQLFKATPLRRAAGIVAALALVACLSSLCILPLVVGGKLVWSDKDTSYYLYKMLKVIPAALLISIIEESFFRVVLLFHLQRIWNTTWAVLGSSALYAVVHFITPAKSFSYTEFDPFAGFVYLVEVAKRLFMPGVLPAFCGLFILGVVLALLMLRTRSIYVCLGLHAGWVMALKAAHYATEVAPGVVDFGGAGRRYFLVADPVIWLLIVCVGLFVAWLASRWRVNDASRTG